MEIENNNLSQKHSSFVSVEGLWHALKGVPEEDRLVHALRYLGCTFHDSDYRFVKKGIVALAGVGGVPVLHPGETMADAQNRLALFQSGAKKMMGASAAFSYLNSGDSSIEELFNAVITKEHFSIAHTTYINFILAGLTEGTELEFSLQRDLVHISKLTNTRTKTQKRPPIVIRNPNHIPIIRDLYEQISSFVEDQTKQDTQKDSLEVLNGYYPVNKATVLMLSGTLGNFRKLTALRNDLGKEREFREVLSGLHYELGILFPQIYPLN